MLETVLNMLHKFDYYNVGEATEIAKGKHEYVTDWSEHKEKIKRAWLLRK